MGDSRNRLYSTRSQLRPMFLSTGSAGSRQVQRGGTGQVQILHELPAHYSSTQPEVLAINNGFGTGTSHTDKETNFASGYARIQGYPEFKSSQGQGHAIGRLSLLGTAQNHGSGYSASFPAREMAENGISLFAEGQTMDEFANKVDSEGGLPILSSYRNLIMTPYTVTGRGNFGEDNIISPGESSQAAGSVSLAGLMDLGFDHSGQNDTHCRSDAARDSRNFSKLPPYDSTAPAAGACLYPVDRFERENSYKDYTSWSEANTAHNHGVNSTVRGPCKRKISALDSPFSGSQSVSSYIPLFPARSNTAISCNSNNGRRITGDFSANSIFTYSGSSTSQTVAPVNALPEVLRTHLPEEACFSQERGFLREVAFGHYEPLRSSHFHEISMPGETAMQCNQESGSTGSMGIEIEHTSTNLRRGYRQPLQVENTAPPVDLWSSRTLQSVAPSASLDLSSAWFTHLSSADRFSGSRGGLSNQILNCGRGNRSLQVTARHRRGSRPSGNGFDDNLSTFRIGQMSVLNQTSNEGLMPDGSFENITMNSYSSESRNRMNSHCHPMSSMNLMSNSSLSDFQIRRVPPCPPWPQSRQLNHSMTTPAYSPPVPQSTTLVPLADSHSNAVSTTFGRHPSSAQFFRGPPGASSVQDHNERLPSAASGTPIGLPLQRIYQFQANDDYHSHMSGGVAEMLPVLDHREREEELRSYEQMLMLEATTLFGGIGMQDQYSDWRLDVDNMSYEDLLALEERIGNVCTGVTEDVISKKLIRRNYSKDAADLSSSQETEVKCSVCQEEYKEGDHLGRLECGHSYHAFCIKQWLVQKNQCPVCKASAFS